MGGGGGHTTKRSKRTGPSTIEPRVGFSRIENSGFATQDSDFEQPTSTDQNIRNVVTSNPENGGLPLVVK